MKPTKDNLRDELKYRIHCLEELMKEEEEKPVYVFLAHEHSILVEIIHTLDVFGDRIGFEQFELSKYTPIRCRKSNELLLIGDYVENGNGQCGTLQFDDYTHRYVIKGASGGNIHTRYFTKIQKLYEYNIDTERVECRTPDKYLKPNW